MIRLDFLSFPVLCALRTWLLKAFRLQLCISLRLKGLRSSVAEILYYKYQNITLSKEMVVTFKKKCNFAHKMNYII